MSRNTMEDRLKSYGAVLEESLNTDAYAAGAGPLDTDHRRRWAKPVLRVAAVAAAVVVAVGIRSLTSDPAVTDTGPLAEPPATAGTDGSPSVTPESIADQCRQGFLLPDGAGVLNGQGINAGDLYRAEAVLIESPIRPALTYVFLATDNALVTCRINNSGADHLFISVDSVGEVPDSESIAIWGAGDETSETADMESTVLNIFGRVGANVTGVTVTIDTVLTEGVVHDGWFLIEATVSDVSSPLGWSDVYVQWSTRYSDTTGRSVADLSPELGLSDLPLRAGGTTIDVSDADIFNVVGIWINQLGLAEEDPALWRQRLQRACSAGVWNEDVGLSLATEFIAADLDKSVRSPDLAEPTPSDGANSLWIMAAQVCPDEFPPGQLAAGPPSR